MFQLRDRVALITGAAGGIGAATSLALASQGADVALVVAPGELGPGQAVANEITERGRHALVLEADVTSSTAVDDAVAGTVAEFGRLDIAVANAGIARTIPFSELDDEHWRMTIETNLGGVLRCFRAAMPAMLEAAGAACWRRAQSPARSMDGRTTPSTPRARRGSSGSSAASRLRRRPTE